MLEGLRERDFILDFASQGGCKVDVSGVKGRIRSLEDVGLDMGEG